MDDERFAVRRQRAFLLLCRDDEMRQLVGTVWKALTFRNENDLNLMLAHLEPHTRFDSSVLDQDVHLLMYRDSGVRDLWSDEWNPFPLSTARVWIAYTFKNPEHLAGMISDIRSARSVWKEEAVPLQQLTIKMPKKARKQEEGTVVVVTQVELPANALYDWPSV